MFPADAGTYEKRLHGADRAGASWMEWRAINHTALERLDEGLDYYQLGCAGGSQTPSGVRSS